MRKLLFLTMLKLLIDIFWLVEITYNYVVGLGERIKGQKMLFYVIKELFTLNITLFTEWKNLYPFLRYFRSKLEKMAIFAQKSTKNGVFFLAVLEIFLLMAHIYLKWGSIWVFLIKYQNLYLCIRKSWKNLEFVEFWLFWPSFVAIFYHFTHLLRICDKAWKMAEIC